MLKRLFDIIVGLIGLIVLAPIFLIIAIYIKIDSKGPIFYRQERHTNSGKIFKIHKFRSMYVREHNDSELTHGKNDLRITKAGHIIRKLHLDEAIQLIDVITGNMSLVGPRPEVPKYLEYYKDDWSEIYRVKSGITGLASIKFNEREYKVLLNAVNKDEAYIEKALPVKLRYEKFYVKKQSFLFDLKIILWTICYFLKGGI